ncbi:MAG: hypothetical protein H7A32_04645 [Deltaproteobacteria bacterium]|nr:hypothetical protein [Deltaproteobacteria bacterium]
MKLKVPLEKILEKKINEKTTATKIKIIELNLRANSKYPLDLGAYSKAYKIIMELVKCKRLKH